MKEQIRYLGGSMLCLVVGSLTDASMATGHKHIPFHRGEKNGMAHLGAATVDQLTVKVVCPFLLSIRASLLYNISERSSGQRLLQICKGLPLTDMLFDLAFR